MFSRTLTALSIIPLSLIFSNLTSAAETVDPKKNLTELLKAEFEKGMASGGFEAQKKKYLDELREITLPASVTYPRVSGASVSYSNAEGRIKDFSTPLLTTAPNSVGDNESQSLQTGISFEFSQEWSGGISVFSSSSESVSSSGTPALITSSDSDAEGLSFSLAYKIRPRLTVGGSHSISDSEGRSSNNATPSVSGSSESRSENSGVYLSASYQFSPSISYNISPSYSWGKTVSKTQNATLAISTRSSSTASFGLNQSLSYNLQDQPLTITGGYSHQYASNETGTANSAKRSPNSGSVYITGTVYLDDGYQIYSTYSQGTGDPIYGDRSSLSLGFASTF